MEKELLKIIKLQQFFDIIKINKNYVQYTLKKPSHILIQNIYVNWLQYILVKTHKNIPVISNNKVLNKEKQLPYGMIKHKPSKNVMQKRFSHNLNQLSPDNISNLQFKLFAPQQDVVQNFIQWQRYRKYWWSSITTSPSLFTASDIQYSDNKADVNIVANFPWGQVPVETVSSGTDHDSPRGSSNLTCTASLEGAMVTLLLDALNNSSEDNYLKLHRKMAPYKISFALDYRDPKNKPCLSDLAKHLYCSLKEHNILSLLPDFSFSMESQLKENAQIGVTYTAVLDEGTLSNGIFRLLSTSTMLQEQVHVADFMNYAKLLFER